MHPLRLERVRVIAFGKHGLEPRRKDNVFSAGFFVPQEKKEL